MDGPPTRRVTVVGAGSWGTTVAAVATNNGPTVLWARRRELAEEIRATRRNRAYLPDHTLPEALEVTAELGEAVAGADVVVMAVPSHGFRAVLEQAAPSIRPGTPVVSLTKGLEQGTHKRMTEIITEVLPGSPVAVLTGPNLAREIMDGQAAASVVACADPVLATALQHRFRHGLFRVYVNHDVIGSEMAGALKNVMAIAVGMADGLGVGDNTRAAVITRGLAEMSRLGQAMGGNVLTFMGLAGMGDLLATCISRQSRNRYVGEQLGRGRPLAEIVEEMQMVAEGVKTSRVVHELAARHGVRMPIAEEVYLVVHHGRTAVEAYRGLLATVPGHEQEPPASAP